MKQLKLLSIALLLAPLPAAQQPPKTSETIEVTATRIAEDVTVVPASITVIDGDYLRARNARDLESALSNVAGVSIAPGGDSGPAGSVPSLWGLREFDAFLLVVDGVPWGGAFNPDLPTLDLTDVDRIEVLRGAAPVMYGATSFVGVIHVIHRVAGAPDRLGRVTGGSHGTFGAAVSVPLSQSAELRQSISASFDRKGFKDQRTDWDRGHVLYRAEAGAAGGTLRFDLDGTVLRQDPGSPHPREGPALTTLVPVGANHNPRGARLDENRFQGVIGFDRSDWNTTLAVTRSDFKILRGFLTAVAETSPNATGFRQDRGITDAYFDTHIVHRFAPTLRVIAGLDHLYGNGHASSAVFDYFVSLNGSNAPNGAAIESNDSPRMSDRRNFSGLYVNSEWTPMTRLNVDVGARLNHTSESRATDEAANHRTTTRGSGALGVDWQLWRRGSDVMALFADYRDTFKPAAVDFGPDSGPDILKPETAVSYEAGTKGRFFGGRLSWQLSAFHMDFENLVVAITGPNGLPALQNAGKERFMGIEYENDFALRPDSRIEFGYSYHDARFRDFVQEFDGVPTQLAGHRLEMSPLHLLGAGFLYMPAQGLNANVVMNYVGARYLTMRNTASAGGYATWSAGIGFRRGRNEIRVDGRNLNDVRPPVSESELGESQYYLLPARSVEISYRMMW
jgi:iron complex outermembrane recepter protein